MKGIGGYFELELPPARDFFIHSGGVMLNSGRHALEYILRYLGERVRKVLLPYYTCDVIWQPLQRLNIEYDFYHINKDLEIENPPVLNDGEYIVVNNYFGIKDRYIMDFVVPRYGRQLIIDNAQAWYTPTPPGICSFYSPRKFFGVPDGGVAVIPQSFESDLESSHSYDKCAHLLKRIDIGSATGYEDFRNSSVLIANEPLMKMSALTRRILSSLDFNRAKDKRCTNFNILHKSLGHINRFNILYLNEFECPLVYPFLTSEHNLRKKLIDNKIFVATYWPNVLHMCQPNTIEYQLAKKLIPLPIDQRYGEDEMRFIIDIILNAK